MEINSIERVLKALVVPSRSGYSSHFQSINSFWYDFPRQTAPPRHCFATIRKMSLKPYSNPTILLIHMVIYSWVPIVIDLKIYIIQDALVLARSSLFFFI